MTWQDALNTAWGEFLGESPVFGSTDCCQFVARYWALLTGTDYSRDFQYGSLDEARSLLRGAGGMVDLITDLLGEPDTDPVPGSVVVFVLDGLECAGVMTDYCLMHVHPHQGIGRTSHNAEVIAAWQPQL